MAKEKSKPKKHEVEESELAKFTCNQEKADSKKE